MLDFQACSKQRAPPTIPTPRRWADSWYTRRCGGVAARGANRPRRCRRRRAVSCVSSVYAVPLSTKCWVALGSAIEPAIWEDDRSALVALEKNFRRGSFTFCLIEHADDLRRCRSDAKQASPAGTAQSMDSASS